ncbi:MAG: segregation/condensation protein A, partial [Terriglobales bacterium]
YEIGQESVTVPEMIDFLREQLGASRRQGGLSVARLFERQRTRRAMICLFLAILELVKRQAVALTQGEAFGDIGLERGVAFDEESADAAQELAAVEQEYR